ncbi:ester cyclase [Bradyrhizobium tropiciagri]|uniref:nuclear transport factor 2 family protein n=1 Tax=Bradyrhizobium tropiciagri TaxID=312253 RepID=UPI001BA6C290|nr:ester cyclase [Bradyrhizobium tropiciagri]MBR0873231.1 ester cyclase [Bradyrhizobium tropiciagri]
MHNLEANKKVVLAFYETAFRGAPERAASEYAGATYIQHNPRVADGTQGFVAFVRGLLTSFPDMKLMIKRVIAEDDLVVTHAHIVKIPGEPGLAVVDIFRVEGGKVVEHWDVVEPVPSTALNSNGMM